MSFCCSSLAPLGGLSVPSLSVNVLTAASNFFAAVSNCCGDWAAARIVPAPRALVWNCCAACVTCFV